MSATSGADPSALSTEQWSLKGNLKLDHNHWSGDATKRRPYGIPVPVRWAAGWTRRGAQTWDERSASVPLSLSWTHHWGSMTWSTDGPIHPWLNRV